MNNNTGAILCMYMKEYASDQSRILVAADHSSMNRREIKKKKTG